MIVGDASPLITFGRLGLLELVFTLVGVVNVLEAVMAEVTAAGPRPGKDEVLIAVANGRIAVLEQPAAALAQRLASRLDTGEAEAIALAATLRLPLLIDERKGRAVAAQLGVHVVGTLGLLDEVERAGFRMSAALRAELLHR